MITFEISATNDVTSVLIAKKCTLAGALIFATEIADCWDDIYIRENDEDDLSISKTVAHISNRGLL